MMLCNFVGLFVVGEAMVFILRQIFLIEYSMTI